MFGYKRIRQAWFWWRCRPVEIDVFVMFDIVSEKQAVKLMWISWSCGQTTPNKIDNNSENKKSSLIELWSKNGLYLRTKCIRKRLGSKYNLVSKNPKYVNDTTKPVNLW